eukprot:TRINITY_DN305_c0_g1_i3.p1 TRINITY_DN305_c0_g1~~TRINITY_DN305_c0_g1_i3.p1  ORF type:complete len:103 (+),score=30.49 TRINITY_DN305_c0_g1_i3:168-476(+)
MKSWRGESVGKGRSCKLTFEWIVWMIVSNIRMVKPEKAKQVEDLFLRNAQTGKLTSKVTEKQLVSTLEALGTQTKSTTKIKFQRKQAFDDSDDDLGLDDDDW